MLDVFDWLAERRDAALAAGLRARRSFSIPASASASRVAENLALLNALPLFHALGQPLLLGASRKRLIGALSNEAAAHQRLGGSLALALKALEAGCSCCGSTTWRDRAGGAGLAGLRDAALTDFSQLSD